MSDFVYRLQGQALFLLSKVTQHTARYTLHGMERLDAAQAAQKPIIFVAWHGMTMMLAGFFLKYLPNSEQVVLMMPDDWRGMALMHWTRRINLIPFPMNLDDDNTLSMARSFVELVRMVRKGYPTYITPDGPHGPAFLMKPGVAYLAQKTNALVVPVGAFTRAAYRLNRWDLYVLPYPFARIHVVIGPPISIHGDEERTQISQAITNALHRVSTSAIDYYYR